VETLIPEKHRDSFFRGAAFAAVFITGDLSFETEPAAGRPETYSRWLDFHMGALAVIRPDSRHRQIEALFQRKKAEDRSPWFFRGAGWQLAFSWHTDRLRDYPSALELISFPVPENRRPDLFWGMGFGAREVFYADPARAVKFLSRLPFSALQDAGQGRVYFEKHWMPEGTPPVSSGSAVLKGNASDENF
jgi:hypothetical protein